MQLHKGACLLLDKPFGFGSAIIIYNSEPDNRHCAISFGYRLSTVSTQLSHPRTASLPDMPTLDEEEAYLAKANHIATWL